MEFDFTYEQLYEMTVSELIDTLQSRRKGLGYKLWKQAYLISWAVFGKNYPKTPQAANPDLYPRKTSIKMPPNLLKRELEKRGGNISYE